ncbi:MAG: tetratricopeptide repeat protein [Bacteroidales bacterium]|nr:tetratricopeptide repeat protein [Bacteroidales bacterium]
MEIKKYTGLIILGLLLFVNSLSAQNPDFLKIIYRAYLENNMEIWKTTIDKMEKLPNKPDSVVLELVNYEYGYVGWCIGTKKTKEASLYLDLLEKNLNKLKNNNYQISYMNAYLSAVYGYKIGLSPFKAPFYGPKSVRYAKLSMSQDSTNPFGYIQYANALYYMPVIFGGSKTEALRYYQSAEQKMNANKAKYVDDNWNYLSLLTSIAKAYEETEQYDKANQTYKKILTIAPDFDWVKNKIYPEFLKKLKEK